MSGQDVAIWLHVHLSEFLKDYRMVSTGDNKRDWSICWCYVFLPDYFSKALFQKLIYAPFPDFAVYVLVSILASIFELDNFSGNSIGSS